ncbi:MAG: Exosome non-catalytic core component [Watsoniomyces obsoletus]|nr:MAG: Exosome non-catalytic core component [Watsoniomyces obsoletus]
MADFSTTATPQTSPPVPIPPIAPIIPLNQTVYNNTNHENDKNNNNNPSVQRPRSCVTCRKRKVKCDKRWPCSNCNRARISCVYPGPERAQRRPKKVTESNHELLARIKKLEGVVRELRGAPSPQEGDDGQGRGTSRIEDHDESMNLDGGYFSTENVFPVENETSAQDGMEKEFGRLLIEEGKSRYGSSSLWASLSEQVEDIKEILRGSSDEDDDDVSPESGPPALSCVHNGFIFGYSSLVVDMRRLHPDPELIPFYWRVFKEGVDPMIKLGHAPTMEGLIMKAKNDLGGVSRGLESLMFAIYHAAVTSLTTEECSQKLGADKTNLLTRYRFGMEQAMARASFLNTQELIVLQAFVTFLICVRRHDETRFTWTLVGLAIRLARALGLHRDGTVFGLSPFDTEMRRRLWWSLCVLDLRAAEDYGSDPTILEQTYDTAMPLNINDEDIHPEMSNFPPSRVGCSEMTFCLLRYEVTSCIRQVDYVPPGQSSTSHDVVTTTLSLPQKEQLIETTNKRLEDRYLQYCDMTIPMDWVTATVGRLVMAKLWLTIYHPFQKPGSSIELSSSVRHRLFVTSIEVLEYARLLETEQSTAKWGWMFRTYVQWHPIAYLLAELCVSTKGDLVDRAWNAINGVFDSWGERVRQSKRGMLWGPLRQLMIKAKRAREEALNGRELGGISTSETMKNSNLQTTTTTTTTTIPSRSSSYQNERTVENSNAEDPFMILDNTLGGITSATTLPERGAGLPLPVPSPMPVRMQETETGIETDHSLNWSEWDSFLKEYHEQQQQFQFQSQQQQQYMHIQQTDSHNNNRDDNNDNNNDYFSSSLLLTPGAVTSYLSMSNGLGDLPTTTTDLGGGGGGIVVDDDLVVANAALGVNGSSGSR